MNSQVTKGFFKLLLITTVVAIAIFALIRFGVGNFLPKEDVSLVSIESEIQLGELIAENMVEGGQSNIYQEQLADSTLWVISSRLLQNLDSTEYDYVFKILDDSQINAFTIPGGRIYTLKGLLSFAETPEEVAAVLAHEIGHAEKRHVVDKLAKEFGINILFSIIAGGDMVLVGDLAQTVLSSAFDRRQEEEADDYALRLLEKSGINPRVMASFFRRMNRENLGYDEHLEMIMSHPHNNARIQNALQYQTDDDFVEVPFNLDWDRIQSSLE